MQKVNKIKFLNVNMNIKIENQKDKSYGCIFKILWLVYILYVFIFENIQLIKLDQVIFLCIIYCYDFCLNLIIELKLSFVSIE